MESENSSQTGVNQNPCLLNRTNLDPDSPYYIQKGLNSSTILVPQPLEGNNYYTWARSMNNGYVVMIQSTLSPEIKVSTFYADTAHQLWLDLEYLK